MGIEYRDNKKCRLVVYAGSDAYGKPIRRVRTVSYTSKRNAEKQYREFEAEVMAGLTKETSERISEMINNYIESRKRKRVRSTTITGYEVIKKRIDETLGDPIASKVTRKMVDDWIGFMDEEKDYSSKTIKNTVRFLSSCYRRYIDLELLDRDPCKHADLPDKPPKERVILSESDIVPFYNALCQEKPDSLDFVVAIELMLFCGLRRSEVTGLKRKHIDMVNRTVTIEDTRHYTGGRYVSGEGTKTNASMRVLSLPEFVFNDIMTLISTHEENARRDENLPEPDYLILGAWGEPIYPGSLYFWLKDFERRYDLPDVNLHGLRHTYASMLKWAGRDVMEIQSQLGHSQPTTTLNTYTHLFNEASIISRDIAHYMDDYICRSK